MNASIVLGRYPKRQHQGLGLKLLLITGILAHSWVVTLWKLQNFDICEPEGHFKIPAPLEKHAHTKEKKRERKNTQLISWILWKPRKPLGKDTCTKTGAEFSSSYWAILAVVTPPVMCNKRQRERWRQNPSARRSVMDNSRKVTAGGWSPVKSLPVQLNPS